MNDDDADEEICVAGGILFGVRRGETETEAARRHGLPDDIFELPPLEDATGTP
ncbi:MAG TPA: hypothetical protein VGM56_20985 [Byssovorax sp.]